MGLLVASLLTLLVVEYFYRVPLVIHAKALQLISEKSLRLVASKHISDHWKEKVLLRYARDVAVHTAVIALMLTGSIVLFVLPALFIDWMFAVNPTTIESITTIQSMLILMLVAILYIPLRNHLERR